MNPKILPKICFTGRPRNRRSVARFFIARPAGTPLALKESAGCLEITFSRGLCQQRSDSTFFLIRGEPHSETSILAPWLVCYSINHNGKWIKIDAFTHQLPVGYLPKKGTSINYQPNYASNIGMQIGQQKRKSQKAESWKLPLFLRCLNVIVKWIRWRGALLAKEPLPHSGAQSASRWIPWSSTCNPHSNRPLWALRPPFYLASSLYPPHKPSILTSHALRNRRKLGVKITFFFPVKSFRFLTFLTSREPKYYYVVLQ